MCERKLLLSTLMTTQNEKGTQKSFCDIDVLVFHAAVGTGVFQAVWVPSWKYWSGILSMVEIF